MAASVSIARVTAARSIPRSTAPAARYLSTSALTCDQANSAGSSSTRHHDQANSNANGAPMTGSEKLLQDALRLEAEEEAVLSRQSRAQDPNDPVWTGEERVQDTLLRMVMDKYKPLRIPHSANSNPADEKIKAGIETPTTPSPLAEEEEGFRLYVPPGVEGAHEGGRKLPKTPDSKPWRAVYVRPAHLLGGKAEEEFQPNIYYGQFLKSNSSDMRSKLKAAGVNLAALPVDDPKAMRQLRAGVKTAERRTKLLRARDSVLDYQLAQSSPSASTSDTTGEVKGDEVSDTNRNLQLQLGHAQGWDSVIEKRIKAALDSGLFKENKLRGKPIQRDMEEKNPFLAREEYFMNRIVKRQGAAPPWVELNMELETELSGWRGRFDESWIRRASRMISSSATLRDGLEPLPLPTSTGPNAVATDAGTDPRITPGETGGEAKLVLEIPAARTPGEQRLIDTATRYRDSEWEIRERAYHTHELKRLNDLVRRHNHLAPFTARKGLMVLDVELEAMYKRTLPRLVYELSALLSQTKGKRTEGWDEGVKREGVVSYDLWGREVRRDTAAREEGERWLDGWLGSGVGAGKGKGAPGEGETGREGGEGRSGEIQNLGLVAAIQRSLQWARERLVRA